MARSDSIEHTQRVNVRSDRMRVRDVPAEARNVNRTVHVQLTNAGAIEDHALWLYLRSGFDVNRYIFTYP